MKTVAEWFESEPDPKTVGASEYHVVHEHVRNIIESEDDSQEGFVADLIDSSLNELAMYAQVMQGSLRDRA